MALPVKGLSHHPLCRRHHQIRDLGSHGLQRLLAFRLDVTPGLTCIWQIKGRSTVTFAEWVRMDLEYIRNRGIVQDVKLIAQTIPAVLLRRGAR